MMKLARPPTSEIEPVLGAAEVHHHLVQFYEDERYLFEVVARYVAEGLAKGEPTVLITSEPHREGFIAKLQTEGVDLVTARLSGRLVLLDARETLAKFMVRGMPDPDHFRMAVGGVISQVAAGGSRVRAYGEMVDLLFRDGNPDAALRLEELWNALSGEHDFALLCGYGMQNFRSGEDARAFHEVCQKHTHVIPSEQYSEIESDDVRLRRISKLEQRAQALAHEVERRKRIEQELTQAVRIREDFLSVAGHELKTPLMAMQLQMDALQAAAAQDGSQRVLERLVRLRKQSNRLGCLVEDLLDVSRLSAGRLSLQLEETDLADVLREVVDRFEDSAARSGTHLRLLTEGSIVGQWDQVRIEQVVTNLLTNALKFGAGKPIEISAVTVRDRARLVVRDNGMGIPLRDQARIFHRFERADASRNYGGLGLGLWIVQQLVEAHSGTVRVDSEPGEGATFTVDLPL